MPKTAISFETIERCARLYASNNAAAEALGIIPYTFGRLCRKYGIETPQVRRRRQAAETRKAGAELVREALARRQQRPGVHTA